MVALYKQLVEWCTRQEKSSSKINLRPCSNNYLRCIWLCLYSRTSAKTQRCSLIVTQQISLKLIKRWYGNKVLMDLSSFPWGAGTRIKFTWVSRGQKNTVTNFCTWKSPESKRLSIQHNKTGGWEKNSSLLYEESFYKFLSVKFKNWQY